MFLLTSLSSLHLIEVVHWDILLGVQLQVQETEILHLNRMTWPGTNLTRIKGQGLTLIVGVAFVL